MGQDRVDGYAEGFRIGWNQGTQRLTNLLKEEYPCVMKKRLCKKDSLMICSGCRIKFKIDKINDEFCVKGEQ